jgi:hypothetical protein
MDGVVEIDLIRLADAASAVPPTSEGSVVLGETTTGRKMGLMRLGRGHQALLPHRAAYRFRSLVAGVILLQTMLGPHSVQKWTKICAT